jgi:glycosyltransferase involved in cell wall biosynthesis
VAEDFVGSIIVPAYNEERRIGPLLPVLSEAASALRCRVIVACNGCRDRTVSMCRATPNLEVLEFEWASKPRALNEAERVAGDLFPRLYVDADVRTTVQSLGLLLDALRTEQPRAVRPFEEYERAAAPWLVRAFYDARYLNPASRWWLEHHLEGHHIYGTNRAGRARFEVFPEEGQMMEDAFFDRMFDEREKVAVQGAEVTVPLPASARELLRARIRIYQGNWQLTSWLGQHRPDRLAAEAGMPPFRGRTTDRLGHLARGGATFSSWRPDVVVPVSAAVLVNVVAKAAARRMARRGEQAAWR